MAGSSITIDLNAVIVAFSDNNPQVLVSSDNALPSGPLGTDHHTLEQGLRAWAGMPIGYIEQLYTFADRDRLSSRGHGGIDRVVSIGYLALVRETAAANKASWSSWYRYFPWEDHRDGLPALIAKVIRPALLTWQKSVAGAASRRERANRTEVAFPEDKKRWNEELVLQRFELLWEAGLVAEAPHQGSPSAKIDGLGMTLAHDHRRILATAIARLRAKIKYRPVVFELMPDTFTLLQLQNAVEGLAGLRLHKQNFRRLIESQGLVEETGAMTRGASGRPAKLFAFRREVLQARAAAGTKLPRSN